MRCGLLDQVIGTEARQPLASISRRALADQDRAGSAPAEARVQRVGRRLADRKIDHGAAPGHPHLRVGPAVIDVLSIEVENLSEP